MNEFKCPLCKQSVSEELYEKITGIWKERRIQEKQLKEKQKELLKQAKEAQRQLAEEKKKLKFEQKTIIETKIAERTKKFDLQISKIESEKNKIKEQADKKIVVAVRSAERKAKMEIHRDLKGKFDESVKKAVEKVTSKQQKDLVRATRTIESTRKQMSTLQLQNDKQQGRIKNLEIQLKKQTTPQLEGLLYEDKLMGALQKEFPEDKFTHTGKGGDILQHIMLDKFEKGVIVYECKKVGHWQRTHAEQAANAKLQRKADFAILVTNATKRGTTGFFIEKGVIVINPGGVLAIAGILREQIIRIAQLKLTHAQKEEAIEKTMQYLQGAEFKNALDLVIRKTIEMYEDLKKECQDHVKSWRKRHDSLKSVYLNTTNVQIKTTALISGKVEPKKEILDIQSFPALPNLADV